MEHPPLTTKQTELEEAKKQLANSSATATNLTHSMSGLESQMQKLAEAAGISLETLIDQEAAPAKKKEGATSTISPDVLVLAPTASRPARAPRSFSPETADAQEEYKKFKNNFKAKFDRAGFGNLADDMEQLVPEFAAIKGRQKMLILETLGQQLYAEVEKRAKQKFDEEIENSKSLGRFKGAAHELGLKMRKNVLLAKYRKETLAILSTSGNAEHDEFLRTTGGDLSSIFGGKEFEARLGKDGTSVYTNFAGDVLKDRLDDPIVETYNQAATTLSRLPYEWRDRNPKSSEGKKYAEAKAAFKAAKKQYLNVLTEEATKNGDTSPKLTALKTAAESESMVNQLNLLSTHPDVGAKLQNIGEHSAFWQKVLDTRLQKTTLMSLGFGTGKWAARASGTLASGALFWSAPITGAVVGAFRGHARGNQTLLEQNRAARVGGRQNEKTAIRMVDIERRGVQLEALTDSLRNSTSEIQKELISQKLKTLTDFLQVKFERGEINFGSKDSILIHQSEFMQQLLEAHTALQMRAGEAELVNMFETNWDASQGGEDAIRARLQSFGKVSIKNTQFDRKIFVGKEMAKSAFYGATFGAAGAAAGYFNVYGGIKHAIEKTWNSIHFPNLFTGHAANSAGNTIDSVQSQTIQPDVTTSSTNIRSLDSNRITPDGGTAPSAHADTITKNPLNVDTAGKTSTTMESVAASAPQAPAQNIEAASVSTTFGRGEGIITGIKHIKQSPDFAKLPAHIQKFFDRNPTIVAKELKTLTADGKSMKVSLGSSFKIGSDGNIYQGNQQLGTIAEDGKFTPGTAKITYLEQATASPAAPKVNAEPLPPVPRATDTVSSQNPPTTDPTIRFNMTQQGAESLPPVPGSQDLPPVPGSVDSLPPVPLREAPIPAPVEKDDIYRGISSLRRTPGSRVADDIYGTNVSKNVSTNSERVDDIYGPARAPKIVDPTHLTYREIRSIKYESRVQFHKSINKYFGDSTISDPESRVGENSALWKAIKGAPARAFMDRKLADQPARFQDFATELHRLAGEDAPDPENMTIEEYTKLIYKLNEQNKIIESHLKQAQ